MLMALPNLFIAPKCHLNLFKVHCRGAPKHAFAVHTLNKPEISRAAFASEVKLQQNERLKSLSARFFFSSFAFLQIYCELIKMQKTIGDRQVQRLKLSIKEKK